MNVPNLTGAPRCDPSAEGDCYVYGRGPSSLDGRRALSSDEQTLREARQPEAVALGVGGVEVGDGDVATLQAAVGQRVVEHPRVLPQAVGVADRRPAVGPPHELVALVRWIQSDGILRTDEELIREAFEELPFQQLGSRIRQCLAEAVERAKRG